MRIDSSNRRLLRARDTMDRRYAELLDVAELARVAHTSGHAARAVAGGDGAAVGQ